MREVTGGVAWPAEEGGEIAEGVCDRPHGKGQAERAGQPITQRQQRLT